jgi:hypothetical protein
MPMCDTNMMAVSEAQTKTLGFCHRKRKPSRTVARAEFAHVSIPSTWSMSLVRFLFATTLAAHGPLISQLQDRWRMPSAMAE